MTKTNKQWGWLLIGLLMGMIIGVLTWPEEAFGAEPIITYMNGQTIREDDVYPSNNQVEEAKSFLEANRIKVPEAIEELCEKYGHMYNIAPELLESMIFAESSFQVSAVDTSGTCQGLMQVKPSAHRSRMGRLGVNNIFDPAGNIATGTDYLAELFEIYEDPAAALMAYNGDSHADQPGYVSEYAEKVLKISQALERAKYK